MLTEHCKQTDNIGNQFLCLENKTRATREKSTNEVSKQNDDKKKRGDYNRKTNREMNFHIIPIFILYEFIDEKKSDEVLYDITLM